MGILKNVVPHNHEWLIILSFPLVIISHDIPINFLIIIEYHRISNDTKNGDLDLYIDIHDTKMVI